MDSFKQKHLRGDDEGDHVPSGSPMITSPAQRRQAFGWSDLLVVAVEVVREFTPLEGYGQQ